MVHFSLLGSMGVSNAGAVAALGGHKQKVVLATLLLHPNQVVAKDRIVDAVWGDAFPRTAAHSIHIYVSELRKALRAVDLGDVLVTREPGYVLEVDERTIDAVEFEALVSESTAHLRNDRPRDALERLERALGLWKGPALADFTYDEFAQDEIRRLEDRRVAAQELLAEAELAVDAVAAALPRLQHLADEHPLRESITALLMEALHRSGRPAEALRAYQHLATHLADAQGIEPSRHLQELEERILLQDPTLEQRRVGGPSANPFKGLRSFEEEDAPDFFGREELVARLVDELRAGTRLVALVGPSGAGKSSVARAGLVPAIRAGAIEESGHWRIAVMTPGPFPFESMASALRAALPDDLTEDLGDDPQGVVGALEAAAGRGLEVLLCLDQLEELFAPGVDEWVRHAFLEMVAETAASPAVRLRVVTTLRGDYYDRPLLYPRFGEMYGGSVISVMPLTPSELGAAVSGPAARAGVVAEPQLIAALVADVAGHSGALPLFQYTLTELYEHRTGSALTLDSYRSFGGLAGALRTRADTAYQSLSAEQRTVLHQVMLRLVHADPEDGTTLRRAPARELTELPVDPVALHGVLEVFGRLRLLTFDHLPDGSPTVELAHEALIAAWPTLGRWVEDSRADLQRRVSLTAAIAAWEEAGRNGDYLPLGSQLRALEQWIASSALQLTTAELEFVEAARRHRRHLEEVEATRRRRTRLLAERARGAGPKVAFLQEGRGDEAYSDLLGLGWDRAMRELTYQGHEYGFDLDTRSQLEAAVGAGDELILGAGYFEAGALAECASSYPEIRFVIIDTVVDLPNVTSILFAGGEGSFLAGIAAARSTNSGIVGFVGGTRLPIIEEFQAGYEAGVIATDPDVTVLAAYFPAEGRGAFYQPDLGERAGRMLIARGADVIFSAAGAAGWGVLEAVIIQARSGPRVWFIGVDNDYYLPASERQRPFILTSVLKRVDLAIYDSVADYLNGTLMPGTRRLGLAEEGVELARSGAYLEKHEPELMAAAARLAAGAVHIPPPRGAVVPLEI